MPVDYGCDNTYYQDVANELLAELKQTKPYKSVAQETHISILRTAAVLAHAFEETLKPFGVTATQYNVLRILRGAGADGLCRNEIRDRMVTPVPDVTRLLDRLEESGYVTRARGVEDRRHMTTKITREGLKLLDRVDGPVLESHERMLAHVGERDLRQLLVLLACVRQIC
jgi:DNA-binding MarR family transcriptional regulator